MKRKFHLAGIGGVGMSALAEAMLDQGYAVTGSDRFYDQGSELPVFDVLARQGIQIIPQDGSGVSDDLTALVLSTAVEVDNPDIHAAEKKGVKIIHRSEALEEIASGKRCVAIAGTCGKTTTTSMVGWILECAEWDPTVVNGGASVDWVTAERTGSVRRGNSEWCVIEADESDKSLLRFSPEVAVITNVSKDHFDLEETVELFSHFAKNTQRLLICGPRLPNMLLNKIPEITATVVCENFSLQKKGRDCVFNLGGVDMVTQLPGAHNAENAFCAAVLCQSLGIKEEVIARALASFHGVKRRLERIEDVNGIRVYDDYAHNSSKIAAAIESVRETEKRLVAVWRPHGFAPLENMWDELKEMFSTSLCSGDRLFILPVFYAGGTSGGKRNSDAFVKELQAMDISALYVKDYEALENCLQNILNSGDTFLCMGARDPRLPIFSRHIATCLKIGFSD